MTALEIKVMRLRIKGDPSIACERLIRIRDREIIPAFEKSFLFTRFVKFANWLFNA